MKKFLTPEMAYPKIKHYCNYQERCHFEVKEKLFGMGLPKNEVETLLSRLIEENYVNEERFAIGFAGGHFRQKKWGKIKIMAALKQKRVTENTIKRALKEINQTNYAASLQKLAITKWKSLPNELPYSRQVKTVNFLLQKGYEMPLILEIIGPIKARNIE